MSGGGSSSAAEHNAPMQPAKSSNPLVDLIESEKRYVEELGAVIRVSTLALFISALVSLSGGWQGGKATVSAAVIVQLSSTLETVIEPISPHPWASVLGRRST